MGVNEISNPLTVFRFLKAVPAIGEPGAQFQAEIVSMVKMPKMQMVYNEITALCEKQYEGFDMTLLCLN